MHICDCHDKISHTQIHNGPQAIIGLSNCQNIFGSRQSNYISAQDCENVLLSLRPGYWEYNVNVKDKSNKILVCYCSCDDFMYNMIQCVAYIHSCIKK